MHQYLHISEITKVIEERLEAQHKNSQQITSLAEHVHQRAVLDTLLLIKNEFIHRSKLQRR